MKGDAMGLLAGGQPVRRSTGVLLALARRAVACRPWLLAVTLVSAGLLVSSLRLTAAEITDRDSPPATRWADVPTGETFEGFAEPFRVLDLAAGEPGVLVELRVRQGDAVRAGDVIGRLDTLVLERTLSIARHRAASQGARLAAQAELSLARRTADQLRQLLQRGNATASELERAETDVAMATARLALAEEENAQQQLECERIEAQIARRTLSSPVDGVVSEVYCEEGESFQANDPRVVTVVQVDRLRVRLDVPPRVAQAIQAGRMVHVLFPELGVEQSGTVEMVSPVIDARSGTRMVSVLVSNPAGELTSGLRCEVDFARTVAAARRREWRTGARPEPAAAAPRGSRL